MYDLATAAVEAALAAGARYADARVMIVRYESMSAKNRVVEGLTQTETAWARAYVRGVTADGVIVLSGEALLGDPQLTIDLHRGTAARQ